MKEGIVLVNFGGPRDLIEVEDFLKTLLCDQDVVRTPFPKWFHEFLFTKIAKKRSVNVKEDYHEIGGKSPIFDDTERLKKELEAILNIPIFTFHRYLRKTHASFIKDIKSFTGKTLYVFPMFPQFSYATTGSCARFFKENLCGRTLEKLVWLPSYQSHPAFIDAYKKSIEMTLKQEGLNEEDVCLLYSFHGVPRKFVCFNDPYEKHCEDTFEALSAHFPKSQNVMAFQSKFGKGEWLRPYTVDLVEEDLSWLKKKHVIFVPASFTSDHIETLFEIENQYKKELLDRGVKACRAKAIHEDFDWVFKILEDKLPTVSTSMLIRQEEKACCSQNHGCCLCKNKSLRKKFFEKTVEQNSR